jgi:hypothetical protein
MKPKSHISCSWKCRRMWGNEHTHSQMNSHFKIGVPMDFQFFRGQLQGSKFIRLKSSSYHWKALGTKMSKMGLHDQFRYLNISYGQKKGQELNCQFDSRPLKVRNRLDLLVCKWHATYHWKSPDEGSNFVSNFTSIGRMHKKLWVSKVA